jgi:hypothetical protein
MPLVLVEDNDVNNELRSVSEALVRATEHAAKAAENAVKKAQGLKFAKDSRKKCIRALANDAYGRVWREVEGTFFSTLASVPSAMSSDGDDPTRELRERFFTALRRAAYWIVDDTCPDEALSLRNVVTAHLQLRRTLLNKTMAKILSLPASRLV